MGQTGTKALVCLLSAARLCLLPLNPAAPPADRTYMRLRSLLATLAAGALVGSTALAAAPAQASAPPVLFGLISPWSGSSMTTPTDDSQLGIHSGIIGSFFKLTNQY